MESLALFVLIVIGFSAIAAIQIWTAKRKSREEEKVLRGYFLRGLAGLMAKVAKADGQVTGNEVELASRYFKRMDLSEDERASCLGYFITASRDNLTAHDHVRRFIAYASSRTAGEFLYDLLWRLSRIDGNVDPAEDALLKEIAGFLGLDSVFYDNFKAGKKPQYNHAVLKAAGVPPSLLALAK